MSRMGSSRLWGKITVLVVVCGWCLSAQAKYGGGSGTPAEPFRISAVSDWQELMATPADWASHFVLTADIDLNDVPVVPIGNSTNQFTGVCDGNDYVIRNVDVNMPGSNYVGLFGCLAAPGQIKNLGVEDSSIFGSLFVGGLVGFNYWGTISNCDTTGSVSGGSSVGGLVGENAGFISNCYSSGSVTGGSGVGGLVGNNYIPISYCYSTGSVTGSSDVGGLVGGNSYYLGIITNCYSTGSVSGTGSVGGLVGYNNYFGFISNCYSTGSVSGTGYYASVGGLVGKNGYLCSEACCEWVCDEWGNCWEECSDRYPGSIGQCYSMGKVSGGGGEAAVGGLVGLHVAGEVGDSFWDIETSEQSTSAGGTPKTTVQMKTQSSFGWDFIGETANGTEDIWAICEVTNYPRLVWQIPQGDIVCPDGVNSFDFSLLARYWHETDCAALDDCDGTDIDLSGAVDFGDVAAVAESWLRGVE